MSKKDLNQLAASIVEQATSEQPPSQPCSARARAGSIGGKKGGSARAAALSEDQRSDIARKAAESRWKKS